MRIQISNLTKVYNAGHPPALDDVSLEIRHGTFGLLGPNGAGKTTLIRILSTQMEPTSGTVTVDGVDLKQGRGEIRRRLGYLPQRFGAYAQLTAWEFLDYRARLGGLHARSDREARVERALHDVGLFDVRRRRAGAFSGGMTRRLGIAQAILTDPDVIIVDEPTVGLDPEERVRFRSILSRLSADRAILISTHIVGDVASTCGDVAILDSGRILYHGPPEALISGTNGKAWTVRVDEAEFESLSKEFQIVSVSVHSSHGGGQMQARIVGPGPPPDDAEPVAAGLEDAYLYFMAPESEPWPSQSVEALS